MITEIYDIQCNPKSFIYVGYSLWEDKYYTFYIDRYTNDSKALYEHLFRDTEFIHVGFNCIENKYPILHYFIQNNEMLFTLNGESVAENLYRYLCDFNTNESLKRETIYGNHFLKQIDLHKIWYFVKKDKEYTIEDLKFALHMPNMSKPKINEYTEITPDIIQCIADYTLDNVYAIRSLLNMTIGNNEHPRYIG